MVSTLTWGWVAMTAKSALRGQALKTFTCQYSLAGAGGGGVGSGAGEEDEEGSGVGSDDSALEVDGSVENSVPQFCCCQEFSSTLGDSLEYCLSCPLGRGLSRNDRLGRSIPLRFRLS